MAPLPMFPLGTVLLPGAWLPLHVFEPRYRALVHDCLEGDGEFGVVLIERGSEVGGGDTRTPVGTVARIVQALPIPDGRWALGVVGLRRIRVTTWLDDDPYPRAEVEDWPDPPAPVTAWATLAEVVPQLRRVLAHAAELGEVVAPATLELSEDPVRASYEAATASPLGPADHQHLLAAPGVEQRLALLRTLLEDAEEVLTGRLALGPEPDGEPPSLG